MFRKSLTQIIRPIKTRASSTNETVNLRHQYLSPSLSTFQAYDEPLVLERGKGTHLWDSKGNKYIDLLGQNLCISVGYGHPKIREAVINQLDKLAHCTTMYYHEQPSNLAKEIVEQLPIRKDGEDWVVHLVNDGSEAVDLAVQMARVYTGRPETIALHKAYHGLQGYAAGLTAIGKATQPSYSSMFTGISHLYPNDLVGLERHLRFGTGGSVGGMILEPLQGYGGIFPLDDGYMRDAFNLIHDYGGVTISDEVQTGYGRCGSAFWGFQLEHNNVVPDMITMAKGMGNGVGIIGAVACKRSIAEAFTSKMFFNTYGSNPIACAAARAVLGVYRTEGLVENCYQRGAQFKKGVGRLCDEYPEVFKEIRGEGLFQGLEIVGNTPEHSGEVAYELHRRMLHRGVIVGRGSAMGNVFRLQPPLCIGETEVQQVVDALEDTAREWIQSK